MHLALRLACFIVVSLVAADASLAQEPAEKLAPPSDAELKQALALVKEVFADDYARATSRSAKQALAKKLLDNASETQDPTTRFALLQVAKEMAVLAGDGMTAFLVIGELERSHRIDVLQVRAGVLYAFSRQARSSPEHKSVAEQSLTLTNEALERYDFETAAKLVDMAAAAARKARERELVERTSARKREVDAFADAYESLPEALAKLENEPTNADANLQVGRFHCLMKGDWDTGLPMLALGSDRALRELARRELVGPADHLDQARLADAWWELSEQENGLVKTRFQQRAGHWYAKAAPKLTGLTRLRTEKRLGMIPSAPTSSRPTSSGMRSGSVEGAIILLTFDEDTVRREGDDVVVDDSSGNNHHGHLSGGKLTEGKVGSALDLNGSSDVLHLPTLRDHLVRDLQTITVACWLNRRKAGVVFDVGGDHQRLFLFDDMFGFGLLDYAPRNADPPQGTWYHVAGTWDGSKQVLYVNGAPLDARDRRDTKYGSVLSGRSIRSEGARVGQQAKSHHRSGRGFGGLVDEFLIHSRALSPQEIKQLYETGLAGLVKIKVEKRLASGGPDAEEENERPRPDGWRAYVGRWILRDKKQEAFRNNAL